MVRIGEILNVGDKILPGSRKRPNHVAVSLRGCIAHSKKSDKSLREVYEESFETVRILIKTSIRTGIPVTTFYIVSEKICDTEYFTGIIDALEVFLEKVVGWDFIHDNQVKVGVIGKWYDLPGRVVDRIKGVIDETKDYDKHFVNLCINYDGQEEIVDACRIIARKIKAEKLEPGDIDKEMLKENMYTAFMPPDLMIVSGRKMRSTSLLLWDSYHATMYFPEKDWPEFSRSDFLKALDYYKKE